MGVARFIAFVFATLGLWGAAGVLAEPYPTSLVAQLPAIAVVPGQSSDDLKSLVRFAPARHHGPPAAADVAAMQEVSHSSLQFGPVGRPVYVLLRLRNDGASSGQWILTTGRSTITSFNLYRLGENGWRTLIDGADVAARAETLNHYQAFATEVGLAPGEEAVFAIRFRDEVSSWMPLAIETYTDFFAQRRSNIALVAAIVAGSLILALFNVVLLAGTGQKVFIWLGLAEAVFAVNTLHAEGYLTIFGLFQYPVLQSVVGEFSRALFGLLMLQFGRELLGTRWQMPRIDRLLRLLMALGGLVVAVAVLHVAGLSIPIMWLHAAGWGFTVLAALFLPLLGWVATRRGGAMFLPLLIGWSALGLYIATTALAISGFFPKLVVNWHWVGPIGLFECVMATLSVGLHLRRLHEDRLAAESEAKQELLARIAISEEASRLTSERAQALASVQARDRLIEMSAHDTRHVLHALSSAVHLGRQTGGELPRRDLMTLIEAAARHLEEIVGSSVTIDNSDGRFLALRLVDVAPLVDDIVTIYTAAAQGSDIRLLRRCDVDARIIVDEALLARVLSNLVNNALRATRSGAIEIACDALDDCIMLSVSDTGPGMPADIAAWLACDGTDEHENAVPQGLGKGWLAIREILALLHGSYLLETGPDGTRVTITLPRQTAGEETVSLATLQGEYPGILFVDLEDLSDHEIERRIAKARTHQVPVFVSAKATAEARVRAATHSQLMLLRPLSRNLMAHPYVLELMTSRAARARSTS